MKKKQSDLKQTNHGTVRPVFEKGRHLRAQQDDDDANDAERWG